MQIGRWFTPLIAIGLLAQAAAAATPNPSNDVWIGTWGYVPAPPPPGLAPPAPVPVTPPSQMPLGTPIAPQPAAAPLPPTPPLLDNPGDVPLDSAVTDLADVTVRQVVRVSAGGQRIRLRFSNEGGTDPLVLGSVHVGEAAADGSIVSGSDHAVTFAGQLAVVIPAGAPLLSDPIDVATKSLKKLYISIYIPGPVAARAPRTLFQYVAGSPGDFSGSTQLPKVRLMRLPVFVTLVEVQPAKATSVVVALGDSITEGALSTANAFRSWPDRLAERLSERSWAVVNAGIGGNRLLRYGAGPNALARLDRDVLSVPGLKAIILLEGINDIGRGFSPTGTTEPVNVEALQAADKQIVARAHEHGIRVIGATLTPYQGAGYASPAGESVREALNEWIKRGGAFDGVIDFASAVADPANPLMFAQQYNDRDHLHPNDAGYKAMADAVDLTLITGK
jgi:lysophospholipase L1-like esterase